MVEKKGLLEKSGGCRSMQKGDAVDGEARIKGAVDRMG